MASKANERRADLGAHILDCITGEDELETDLTDALANVIHYIEDRLGFDAQELWDRAQCTHQGDMEDGPPAKKRRPAGY